MDILAQIPRVDRPGLGQLLPRPADLLLQRAHGFHTAYQLYVRPLRQYRVVLLEYGLNPVFVAQYFG